MRAFLLVAMLAGVVGLGYFACNPKSTGRPCVNATGAVPLGTQITSPSLECPSRLCLIQPPNTGTGTTGTDGGVRATCTAPCSSDDDCAPETTAYCSSGFKCAVATDTGKFCCRKLCICID